MLHSKHCRHARRCTANHKLSRCAVTECIQQSTAFQQVRAHILATACAIYLQISKDEDLSILFGDPCPGHQKVLRIRYMYTKGPASGADKKCEMWVTESTQQVYCAYLCIWLVLLSIAIVSTSGDIAVRGSQ
jgi:hypothetical protein